MQLTGIRALLYHGIDIYQWNRNSRPVFTEANPPSAAIASGQCTASAAPTSWPTPQPSVGIVHDKP